MGDTSKTIILCFDGTTNQFGVNNSNIAKLYSLFSKEDPRDQVAYYQLGLGQYYNPGTVNPLTESFAQIMDWCFAWYIDQHIIDGYRFLVQNWNEGDRIFIFGFSRGAYTARCVAGMVNKVGLVSKDNDQTLTFAYRLYERTDAEGIALSASFKRTFSRTVPIDFVGCFDTVASVGLIQKRELPFTATNNEIRIFRHCLALDEHRVRFTMSPYNPICPTLDDLMTDPSYIGSIPLAIPQAVDSFVKTIIYKLKHPAELLPWFESKKDEFLRNPPAQLLNSGVPVKAARKLGANVASALNPAEIDSHPLDVETDVKEVWFTGCHSDIGGCAVLDTEPRSLGDITLRWMVKEIIASEIPVKWRPGVLEDMFGTDPTKESNMNTAAPLPDLDALDAEAPIHDDLNYLYWWPLEFQPDSWTWQDSKGTWYRQWKINLGRPRRILGVPTIHHSVRQRMENPKLNYKPRAVYNSNYWE